MSYVTTTREKWFGRIDPAGSEDTFYWHQVVQFQSVDTLPDSHQPNQIVFLGYQSDEGVKRNSGRVGAAKGPEALRAALSKMALHFEPNHYQLIDVGDVVTDGSDLEQSQLELAEKVEKLLRKGYLPIVLGGGHEISYGHGTGIRQWIGSEKKLGIINLDAHFDLRPYPAGPHSGSPFRQLMDDCYSEGTTFHYLPIGINPAGNQKVLFEVHRAAGQQYVSQKDLEYGIDNCLSEINQFSEEVDHLYLTLDLDVLPASAAPGVSAPAAFGVDPVIIRRLVDHIFSTGKVVSFDVAELNPLYDDGRTAKLAASIIYDIVMKYSLDQ